VVRTIIENPKVIFPDVEIKEFEGKLHLSTAVRVPLEDGSGHYFWTVGESFLGSSNRDWQWALCRFNEMVYMSMVMGKLNEDLLNRSGLPLHNMDESKETERERMKRIMLKKLGV